MRTNKLKMIVLLMCIAAAFSIASCDREDGPNNNGGGGDNTPLTNETIVGKKLYTNKLPSQRCWLQSEIRFAANDIAYLTNTRKDYESGEENVENPKKATFNLVYPDVVFETEDGKSYSATFTDNNTLVFAGGEINEEQVALEYWGYDLVSWNDSKGWRFTSNPQTITGPYAGQLFRWSLEYFSLTFVFGANYVYHTQSNLGGIDGTYSFIVNYPNISIGDFFEGYFVGDTAIILTKYYDREWSGEGDTVMLKRIR